MAKQNDPIIAEWVVDKIADFAQLGDIPLSRSVAWRAAHLPNLSEEALLTFARNPNPDVRLGLVLVQAPLPPSVVDLISRDPDHKVRDAVPRLGDWAPKPES